MSEQKQDFIINQLCLAKYVGEGGDVVIPDGVIAILNDAFAGCDSITSITIPKSVTMIGNNAFKGCKRMNSINIPESVFIIHPNAFDSCYSLCDVHITNLYAWLRIDFVNIFANPLVWAKNLYLNGELVTEYAFDYGEEEINYSRIAGYSSLEHVIIGDNTTSVANGAFKNCSNLSSVVIGRNVKSIGNEAFADCKNLKKVYIPASVESIGDKAFDNCDILFIYTEATKKPKKWVQPLFGKERWNPQNRPVIWGGTKSDFDKS